MKIGTIATSGGELNIQLNYCPQFLLIETPRLEWDSSEIASTSGLGDQIAGRVPQALRVNVAGDGVIFDAVKEQLQALKYANQSIFLFPLVESYNMGQAQNWENEYLLINLADGFVKNKVTEIYMKNVAAAVSVNVYAFSLKNDGLFYMRKTQEKVLANSGIEISDFSRVIFGMSDSNVQQVDISFRDGLQQKFSGSELSALNTIEKQVPVCVIDNIGATISRAFVLPSADTTVLVEKLFPVKSAQETSIIVKERVSKQILNNPVVKALTRQ